MDDSNKKTQNDKAMSNTFSNPSVEQEPVPVSSNIGLKETVHEHSEIRKPKEVAEFVKDIPAHPRIPQEIEQAGLRHTGAATPVKQATGKTIKLPLTDDEIVKGLHAHIWESIRWMSIWCVRQLKKAHIAIKEIHGKLVRN